MCTCVSVCVRVCMYLCWCITEFVALHGQLMKVCMCVYICMYVFVCVCMYLCWCTIEFVALHGQLMEELPTTMLPSLPQVLFDRCADIWTDK